MARDDLRPDIQAAADRLNMKLGARREIRKLVEHLEPGETVEMMAPGAYGKATGLLAMTTTRLLFIQDSIVNHVSEVFHYSKISSVAWKSGMMTGTITIMASGARSEVTGVMKEPGKAMVDAVRARLATPPPAPSPRPQPAPAATSSATDDLARLAQLHQSGALSDAEFAAAKAKLLGL